MPKAGAYYLYMLDFKKEQERKHGSNLNLAEVSQMASNSWNAMSESDKEYYREKSKSGNVKIPRRGGGSANGSGFGSCSVFESGQLTSQGQSVAAIERQERAKRVAEETMRRRIGEMFQTIPLMTDFRAHPLFFMYGNYFYKTKAGHYAPAELALVKFTFQDGVISKMHTFINPGKPELGYAYTVKAHSDSTHRLPPPPDAFGEKNLNRVYSEIEKFMSNDMKAFDGGNQMIFTYSDPFASEDNQITVLKSFMEQMQITGERPKFDLYPLTRLFYTLRKELFARGCCTDIPNENFSNVFLSRDPYETISGISCDFHEEKDATQYCALSRVRRWSFLLADHFCEHLGVELTPGVHLPINAALSDSSLSLGSAFASDSESENVDDLKKQQPHHNSNESVSRDDFGASVATLNYDVQSVKTSSSMSSRSKIRPSRASTVAQGLQPQSTSSTFYTCP